MSKIQEHKFFDKDIDSVIQHNESIELGFPEGTLAILLKREDVKALAIYFGIIDQ